MAGERRPKDPWAGVPSADIKETQDAAKRAQPLCHVGTVHGNVINVQLPSGTALSDVLRGLAAEKAARTCET